MFLYFLGKIKSIKKSYIIFENNFIGYVLNIVNPDDFKVLEKVQKVYIYEHKNDYQFRRYAFKDFKSRLLFEDLLTIPGIGPRTAISILKHGIEKIMKLVTNADVKNLSKLPYIGQKMARQIIIEFEDKYNKILFNGSSKIIDKQNNKKNYDELKSTLKILGFKSNEINMALDKVKNFSLPQEKLVEESIKLISHVS